MGNDSAHLPYVTEQRPWSVVWNFEAPLILVSCRVKVACRKAGNSDLIVHTVNIPAKSGIVMGSTPKGLLVIGVVRNCD
jgi:hypothetical protein